MSEFRMPALGADMEAGTLVQWVKRPGDVLKRGDIIAVVDTQKGAIEVEVFEDGVLEKTLVEPGREVPVGTVLAIIASGEGASERRVPPTSVTAPVPSATDVVSAPAVPRDSLPSSSEEAVAGRSTGRAAFDEVAPRAPLPDRLPLAGRARVSPLARRLAADLGVDLATIVGTGPQGAITREDVERAATRPVAPSVTTGASAVAPPDRRAAMRAAIGAAMSRAKREIPHYYLSTTVDVTTALAWLRSENERRAMPDRLLPAVLLVKAAALAVSAVPELNGHWTDGAFRPGRGVHVGIAIALRGGGLVAPAVHDADTMDLATLMRRLRDLVERARAGALRSSELADPTITVTNLGDQGVDSAFGIIYPPQVALVGFGKIAERPWVVDGRLEPRWLVTATLSADHRASDGHRGGLYLAAIDRALQAPERL